MQIDVNQLYSFVEPSRYNFDGKVVRLNFDNKTLPLREGAYKLINIDLSGFVSVGHLALVQAFNLATK